MPEILPVRSSLADRLREQADLIEAAPVHDDMGLSLAHTQTADLLRLAADALTALKEPTAEAAHSRSPQCSWTEDDDGIFNTDCDEAFVFTEGMPEDNKVKFCCYCGKPIRVVLYKAPEWDDDGEPVTPKEPA